MVSNLRVASNEQTEKISIINLVFVMNKTNEKPPKLPMFGLFCPDLLSAGQWRRRKVRLEVLHLQGEQAINKPLKILF